MSLNNYIVCRFCGCLLLVDSIYSYEGYCFKHFPLPIVESEKDICLTCIYYVSWSDFCNSPLGVFVPVWWRGDVCLHPATCSYRRLDRRRFPDGEC